MLGYLELRHHKYLSKYTNDMRDTFITVWNKKYCKGKYKNYYKYKFNKDVMNKYFRLIYDNLHKYKLQKIKP